MIDVVVRDGALDTGIETEPVRLSTDVGAMVIFSGHVRGTGQEGRLVLMEIEHYPGVTEQSIRDIGEEAVRRWDLHYVRVEHAVGNLQPGDCIVIVQVTASHRAAAFSAAEFIMDYLKTRAPFWKKEHYENGRALWLDARNSDAVAAERWRL